MGLRVADYGFGEEMILKGYEVFRFLGEKHRARLCIDYGAEETDPSENYR